MSLNPSAEGKSLYDVLEGSVTSYFTRLAGVLQRNESVNGRYMTTTSSCYGGNTPVRIPGFARVCLSTNGSDIVDVANSFVTMNIHYKFRLSEQFVAPTAAADRWPRQLFVGFKNSIEALSRYDIFVNSNLLYSQTWTGPESFLYNQALCQTIKEKCPYVHTCYDNAVNKSPDVCGVYVDLSGYAAATDVVFEVDIPVKINLQQILLLTSVRYLPSFAGRWELELYPNWNNIVVLPVYGPAMCSPAQWTAMNAEVAAAWKGITQSFTQIGQKFRFMENFSGAGAGTLCNAEMKLTCNEGTMDSCLMNLTTFQLRSEVYEGLRQMYAEQPLIIPTQVLHYARFSGQPGTANQTFHATLSQCLENCDSVFILVPNNNNQTTCFYQPYLQDVRLSLGEFGIHPANYVRTFDDPRFLAIVLDALNLETSEITAMNKDLARSLTSPRPVRVITDDGAGTHTEDVAWQIDYGDKSNFFIGISLSQVGFQSGTVSSPNTNIPFIFDAQIVPSSTAGFPPRPPAGTTEFDTSIIAMFLLDAALIIQVVPNSDIPIVKLTTKSIV